MASGQRGVSLPSVTSSVCKDQFTNKVLLVDIHTLKQSLHGTSYAGRPTTTASILRRRCSLAWRRDLPFDTCTDLKIPGGSRRLSISTWTPPPRNASASMLTRFRTTRCDHIMSLMNLLICHLLPTGYHEDSAQGNDHGSP